MSSKMGRTMDVGTDGVAIIIINPPVNSLSLDDEEEDDEEGDPISCWLISQFKTCCVELANGDFTLVQLKQRDKVPAIFDRIGKEVQLPLVKYETAKNKILTQKEKTTDLRKLS